MSRQLLIHADRLTARLRYVTNLLLGERLGLELYFSEHHDEAQHSGMPALRYGATSEGNALFIRAQGLLEDTGLKPFDVIMITDRRGMRVPMAVRGEGAAFDFDPLAAAFYLLTRYEEHLPNPTDIHGRFDGRSGLAFRECFHKVPVIDIWVQWLRDELARTYPEMRFNQKSYRFTPTIDIDNAYAYKHKGLWLNVAGALRSLARGQWIMERARVLLGMQPDPYDNYGHLTALHREHGLRAIYFLLLADRGPYDRNLAHDHAAMKELVRTLAQTAHLGIHPGYASGQLAMGIAKEAKRLEAIKGDVVNHSRHHFIKISFPITYKSLVKAGIKNDYSMGYYEMTGFRAGTSDSFLYYDLSEEAVTALRIHPFACMDVSLRSYLRLTPQEAVDEIGHLASEIRAVGGHMITLWHNESVRDQGPWKGWQRVYTEMLKLAKP